MERNIFFVFSLQAFAQTHLGKELQILKKNDGGVNLGVHYSYELDMKGVEFQIQWSILYATNISNEDRMGLPASIKWNLYSTKSNSFLLDWNTQPSFESKNLFLGSVGVEKNVAKEVIGNQTSLILVFADLRGVPLYHLQVGKLCLSLPTYFNNLTEPQKRCSQVTVSDVDAAMKSFCAEKSAEFLDYVNQGLLKCELASKKFESLGCGVLRCP